MVVECIGAFTECGANPKGCPCNGPGVADTPDIELASKEPANPAKELSLAELIARAGATRADAAGRTAHRALRSICNILMVILYINQKKPFDCIRKVHDLPAETFT